MAHPPLKNILSRTFNKNQKANKIGHSSRSSSIQRSKTTEKEGNVKQF